MTVLVNDREFKNMRVVDVFSHGIVVKYFKQSSFHLIIRYDEIQELELNTWELKDPPGTLVTSLILLFFLLV